MKEEWETVTEVAQTALTIAKEIERKLELHQAFLDGRYYQLAKSL